MSEPRRWIIRPNAHYSGEFIADGDSKSFLFEDGVQVIEAKAYDELKVELTAARDTSNKLCERFLSANAQCEKLAEALKKYAYTINETGFIYCEEKDRTKNIAMEALGQYNAWKNGQA